MVLQDICIVLTLPSQMSFHPPESPLPPSTTPLSPGNQPTIVCVHGNHTFVKSSNLKKKVLISEECAYLKNIISKNVLISNKKFLSQKQ